MEFFDKLKNAIGLSNNENDEFKMVFSKSIEEYSKVTGSFYSISVAQIPTYTDLLKKWNDKQKLDFILFLIPIVKKTENAWEIGKEYKQKENYMASTYIITLLRSKLKLSEEQIVSLYESFKKYRSRNYHYSAEQWPITGFYRQIEGSFSTGELPNSIKNILNEIMDEYTNSSTYQYKDRIILVEKIKTFLYKSSDTENKIKPSYFIGTDQFKDFANEIIDKQNEEDKIYWYTLMILAQKATGSKPSQKYLNEAKETIDQLGADKFKKVTQEWFNYIINLKEQVATYSQVVSNQSYNYSVIEFLNNLNADAIKGFVWMTSWFYDATTIQTISKLAERSYKKIPEKGPAAAGVGNACLYTLYASKGLDGIAQLSRLRLKIKQNNTLSLIEKYIDDAAKKLNISFIEIEDLAVDNFKLVDHKIDYDFDTYICSLELTGIGKSVLKWFKQDGTEQKTVPLVVKEKFASKLKKVKDIQKRIDQTTSSQKERFDRMLRSKRVMSLQYFNEKYIDHGLISFVIDKVIFKFSKDGDEKLGIYINKQWIGLDYKAIDIAQFTNVELWHPVTSSTNEVKEWRQFLMDSKIQQPFKQAYREIYILTDAEVNTKTYSNRMASHILKQHQYVTLAKGRNWKARLIGAWDGGDQDTAQLMLSEYKLTVEYWVNALDSDEQYNATGIWNYVTTDQIRFVSTETNEPVDLIDVPPVAFSEAMRDIDLFVGVASVGNDPTWSDSGGLPTYRSYWQSYSFGDLSEIAKNRKEILQSIIPRLKIASVAHIEDKFLVVEGKIRTYKIHIGSTNILMKPNDQYLCIVADRNKKNEAENVFLPFEGDTGLSIIISKAFLLANDDKITDTSITSQINR
ncbi:MAG: DUF4132 domain-containing protein [Bacteroidetes bacterium]|nr:DUF4132 domain-containing protein [Bacteroidota bacterium]